MRSLAALALCLALPAAAQTPDREATEASHAAAADTIAGGYASLAESAEGLVSATDAFCEAPSKKALDTARTAFALAVRAWSRIETVRFGPILSDNAAERIFVHPDRRGIGLRQVQAALAEEDPAVTDAHELAGRSVALQGLGTAEYLLRGDGVETLAGQDGAFHCAFTSAVARRAFPTNRRRCSASSTRSSTIGRGG